jgi:AT-rich interactive domain-containing protein 2
VAQRQQQQQQQQLQQKLQAEQIQPAVSASTIVQQKPLVVTANSQSLTNIKIGSSTISIKPGTLPNNTVITANPIPNEAIMKTTTVEPPPLAPLSNQTPKIDGNKVIVAASQKISANKMLVDLLDKKALEPPVFPALAEKTVTLKRKIDGTVEEVPAKKADTDNIVDANPNAKAADLYAKLAGSILEDEEMEDDESSKVVEKKVEVKPAPQPIINTQPVPVQRQLIMTPNNQVILSPGAGTPTATATIKTDSGIQTVPILLQNPGMPGQFIQQPTLVQQQSAPTQYILATNNQGQTYVVAQQQAPQTVLLAQTPQQQGTGTKTIIILQQQPQQQIGGGNTTIQQIGGLNVAQQSSQKIIMTPHGQQVFVTQVPRPYQQQQVIQGYQPTNTNIIQGQSQGRKIIITNTGNAVEVDGGKSGDNQQILKQFTTASGTKIIQTVQPQVYQQTTNPQQAQTKIIQGTSQQTIQALAQGQNIIVQKGQKFQIGNTQISQIIQPQAQQQIVAQPSGVQQQQTQQIIIQKTIMQPQTQTQLVQQQIIQQNPVTQVITTTAENKTHIVTTMAQQSQITQQIISQQAPLIPATIQQQIPVTQPSPVQEITQQIPIAQKSPDETSAKSEDADPAAGTSGQTKTFSIQIPVPAGSQPGAPQQTVKVIPAMDPNKIVEEDVDPNWLYVCDWRGCPK